jgi:EmrB/QacA subfamily drug resistance transporter
LLSECTGIKEDGVMARKWWVLAAVCAGVMMLLLDVTIVNVALPSIERDFSATLADLQWVISGYALALAAFMLTAGSLADRYGRRRLFAAGLVLFTVASTLCGLSTGPIFLVVARAVQGVGGAIMFATSLALLADAFRGKDRAVAFGVFGAVTGAAVAVGPVLGGLITSGLSWRWIFFVNIPVGAVALLITALRVPESKDAHAAPLDIAGFVSFSAALVALVFGLIRSTDVGWGSAQVVGSLIAGGVLLGLFGVIEYRTPRPMFDLSLLKVPTFVGGLLAAFGISASLFSLLTYLIIYMQNILGFSAVGAGLRFLPLTGAIFVTAGIAGRLSGHAPRRVLIGAGFVLIAAGLFAMRGVTVTSSWTHLVVGMVLAGVGAGLVNVPLVSTAVGVVHPSRAGMASGINNTLRQAGVAAGVAVLGTIFAAQIRASVNAHLSATPLAAHAAAFAHAISTGGAVQAVSSAPAALRATLAAAAQQSFVDGLNLILLIGAVAAGVAALTSLVLIRERDFVSTEDVGERLLHAAA